MATLWKSWTRRYGLRDLKSTSRSDDESSFSTIGDTGILNAAIEVKIERINGDFSHAAVLNPFVCVHLCSEKTGQYLPIHSNSDCESTPRLVGMKQMFPQCFGHTAEPREVQIKDNEEDVTFVWEERIIINGNYKDMLDESSLFLFEILDLGQNQTETLNKNGIGSNTIDSCLDSYHRVAWGFLKAFGKDGRCNVGVRSNEMGRCNIQLYRYQSNSFCVRHQARVMDLWSQTNVPRVFLQYLRWSNLPVHPSLHIAVGPVPMNGAKRQESKEPICSDDEGSEQEKIMKNCEVSSKLISSQDDSNGKKHPFFRQAEDSCLLPDKLIRKVHNTCAVKLKFSHCGNYLAIASILHSIYIYDVHEGLLIYRSSFHDDEVTAIDWSYDNFQLCSASRDGTVAIHQFDNILHDVAMNRNMYLNYVPKVVLPLTPSFPISLAFVPLRPPSGTADNSLKDENNPSNFVPSFLVSANGISLKIWDTSSGEMKGEISEKMDHHLSSITALSRDEVNGRIFSGDESGCIIIWKKSEGITTLESLTGNSYTILRRINFLRDNTLAKGIQTLHCHTNTIIDKKKILLVTTKCKKNERSNLFSFEFSTQTLEPFCFETKMRAVSFSEAIHSPCGNFVVGSTHDGMVQFMESSGAKVQVSNGEEVASK